MLSTSDGTLAVNPGRKLRMFFTNSPKSPNLQENSLPSPNNSHQPLPFPYKPFKTYSESFSFSALLRNARFKASLAELLSQGLKHLALAGRC